VSISIREPGRKGPLAAIAAAAALAALALPIGGSAAGGEPVAETAKKKVKVKVGDDFFSPTNLKVKKGTKVKWKWLPENGNPHNVTLTKGPKGVKKKDLTSATGTIGIKFNRKLKKKGTYKFICTIHATVMKQTVKVKR
jgi:plastocyanin